MTNCHIRKLNNAGENFLTTTFKKVDKGIWEYCGDCFRATGQQEINHVYFGKIVTVIGLETLDRVKISVDNFPQCNGRIFKNQFVADKDELEELPEK